MRMITVSLPPRDGETAPRSLQVHADRSGDGHLVVVLPDGRRLLGATTKDGALTWVSSRGRTLRVADARAASRKKDDGGGSLEAPMPGKVVKVLVEVGDVVVKGQVLLAVEAMKMEHALKAPRAGRVRELRAAAGDQVVPGAPLIVLEDAS